MVILYQLFSICIIIFYGIQRIIHRTKQPLIAKNTRKIQNDPSVLLTVSIESYLTDFAFILFIALDHADWILTPDWFLSAIPKVLQGKFQKDVYARDSHLRNRPMLVLEKFEEDAITEEETRAAQPQVAGEQEVLTVEAAAK
ncbi:Conserved_hypothetical protein [Hexamita inflata]|uniref:Uncharacterized protein n=1 Tax=Hexamita inflata TaxID=28002 RepID=A0AA86PDF8_9EUKA|nr:Conserved hypothetical protein [Hexamita inflata]